MSPNFAPMTATQVAKLYFDAFERNDLDAIVGLFAEDAVVRPSSRSYLPSEPRPFYQKILDMTQQKTITVYKIEPDPQNPNIAIAYFGYDWTLTDGSQKNFTDASDYFEINRATGKIISLTINLGADILAK